MTERSTCWSLTQQVATKEEAVAFMKQPVPPGWKLTGQIEEAPTTGKLHLQLMLETPRIRFGAVKKQFSQAHIEVARNKHQLGLYVKKDDTRVGAVAQPPTPTIWEFNIMVANRVKPDELTQWLLETRMKKPDDIPNAIYADGEWYIPDYWTSVKPNEMLDYIDIIVKELIREGVRGAEYMGVNPMFRSAWKTYGKALIERAINEEILSDLQIYNAGQDGSVQAESENGQDETRDA